MRHRGLHRRLDRIEHWAAVDPAACTARHDAYERACQEWIERLIATGDAGPLPVWPYPWPQDPERTRQVLLEDAVCRVLWATPDATAQDHPWLTDDLAAGAAPS
jgi:hypothetical protein